jgi:hypothetical protein
MPQGEKQFLATSISGVPYTMRKAHAQGTILRGYKDGTPREEYRRRQKKDRRAFSLASATGWLHASALCNVGAVCKGRGPLLPACSLMIGTAPQTPAGPCFPPGFLAPIIATFTAIARVLAITKPQGIQLRPNQPTMLSAPARPKATMPPMWLNRKNANPNARQYRPSMLLRCAKQYHEGVHHVLTGSFANRSSIRLLARSA